MSLKGTNDIKFGSGEVSEPLKIFETILFSNLQTDSQAIKRNKRI